MFTPTPAGAALAAARRDVAEGNWHGMRARLAADSPRVREHPELALLLGEAFLRTGDPRGANAWLGTTLPTLRRSGDRAAIRRALNLLGAARFAIGETRDAEASFGQALELARNDGDSLLVARALNNLGAIANVHGRHAEALACYRLAIPVYQQIGNRAGLAESYHNMAITCRDIGELDRGMECEMRALEFAREAGSTRLVALAWLGRADLNYRKGDAGLAEAGAWRAAREFASIGEVHWEADALRQLGVARLALGKLAEARGNLDRAVQLAAAHGAALIEGEAHHARAELGARTGDLDAARDDAAAALAIYARLGAEREHARLTAWVAALGH